MNISTVRESPKFAALRKLRSVFPMRKKNYLAIIIQDGLLTIAAVEQTKTFFAPHIFKLTDFNRIKIEPEVVNRSEVTDCDQMLAYIPDFITGKKFSSAVVITLCPDTLVKFMTVPVLKHSELRKFKVSGFQDSFPVTPSEYVFDCKITGSQVFMAALPRRTSESYISLFSKLGICLEAVDIFENCICRYTGTRDKDCHLTAFETGGDYVFIFISDGIARDICRIHGLQDDFMGIGRLSVFISRYSIKIVYLIDMKASALTDFFVKCAVEAVELNDVTSSPDFYRMIFT